MGKPKLMITSGLLTIATLITACCFQNDTPLVIESNKKVEAEWPQVAEFNKRIKDVGMVCFESHISYRPHTYYSELIFQANGVGRIGAISIHRAYQQIEYKMTRNGEVRLEIQDGEIVWPPMILRWDAESMFLEFLDTSTKPSNQETLEFEKDVLGLFPFRFVDGQY